MFTRVTLSISFVLALGLGASVGNAGSLVGYWSFDEGQGTVVHDQSGSGNDGTINGSPLWIEGPFGKALQLNGTSDYVDCGNAESLNITDKLTVSAWVKTVDAGEPAEGQMGGQNHYVSKDNSYQMKHRTNLLIFAIWDGGPHATRISIDNSFNGEWHHVVGTYDGSVLKTYVDGKLEGEASHEGSIDLNEWNVNIGKNPANEDQYLNGGIDEVRIYARDLSASQVWDLFMGDASFFLKAQNPQPEDDAKGVSFLMLKWVAGEDAVSHAVYLGTDPNLTQADFQVQTDLEFYWHTEDITPGETYYWRIDEIQADGTTIVGNVWSFTAAMLEAYDPRPRDGAKWVDPNGVGLSWEVGIDAYLHDIYFGTDKAVVEAGDASVFIGNMVLNRYEPGTLEKETTYYWRIDEHTTVGKLNKGNIWTFATSGGSNDGVKAEYFRNPDMSGQPTVVRTESRIDFQWPDGDVEGINSPAVGIPTNEYSARWSGELQVAYSGEYRFVINVNNSGILWLDDRLLIDRWPNTESIPEYTTKGIELVAGRGYFLVMEWNKYNPGALARLEWIDPFGDRMVIPSGYLQLPLRANRPKPGAGQIDVTHMHVLNWSPGYKAARHDVYFGADAEAVANADTSSPEYRGNRDLGSESYEPGELQWNTTYYWRVDEVNNLDSGSPWVGYLWSFTTSDFLVVEDFEDYNDYPPDEIFSTWIDGWEVPTNGSMAGHAEPPFAETTIVHGGGQSMPLYYENNFKYSEAAMTLVWPRDWTEEGVGVLSLWFYGDASNAAERMYVALNGSAVVYHDNPNAAQIDTWTQWTIDLQEFATQGVNLANVNTISIGFGDKNNLQAGGSGMVLFDDIRLYRLAL